MIIIYLDSNPLFLFVKIIFHNNFNNDDTSKFYFIKDDRLSVYIILVYIVLKILD